MTSFQALNVLAAHYTLEVQRRHGNPVFDANTEANLLALARYLTQPDPKFGVMMCGTCGNGKTTLLYTLQSAINDLHYRFQQMLAIDDLGKEPTEVLNFGNVVSPVVDLLEYRYNHQLFTVVTTNLTPKEIREKYGARIADRFNEMLEVIRFQDISYRRLNR